MAALLTVKTSSKVNVQVPIEETTRQKINGYAAFCNGTPEAVIESALEYVFSRDKEFSAFMDKNPAVKELLTPVVPRTRAPRQGAQ